MIWVALYCAIVIYGSCVAVEIMTGEPVATIATLCIVFMLIAYLLDGDEIFAYPRLLLNR
jgi:hypothetical protein